MNFERNKIVLMSLRSQAFVLFSRAATLMGNFKILPGTSGLLINCTNFKA